MADITQLRFAQLLRRTFGLKGTGGDPGRVMSPVIGAQYDIADHYRPEDRALRGEKLWGLGQTLTNTAAINFGFAVVHNAVKSNRISIIRRATWSLLIPTAANQPGNVYLDASPVGFDQAILTQGYPKDGRYGTLSTASLAATGFTAGSGGAALVFGVYHVAVFPGAATQAFIHQVNDLDVVLPPGFACIFRFASDTLPIATYQWTFQAEGYERTADQNELLFPPA